MDTLTGGRRLAIARLLTFATPHIGSMVANAGKWLPWLGKQAVDMAIDFDFLLGLSKAWSTMRAEDRVRTRYVVAAKDKLVTQTSAAWTCDYDVIGGTGHTTVHVPASIADECYVITRRFLLDPSPFGTPEAEHLQPGLTLNLLNTSDEASRFQFGARRTPLLGRDTELERLGELLDHPDLPFRWLLMYGSGGVGKSWLARILPGNSARVARRFPARRGTGTGLVTLAAGAADGHGGRLCGQRTNANWQYAASTRVEGR